MKKHLLEKNQSQTGVESNSQKANWNEKKQGYVFLEGHFKKDVVVHFIPLSHGGGEYYEYLFCCWDADVTFSEIMANGGTYDKYDEEGNFIETIVITPQPIDPGR